MFPCQKLIAMFLLIASFRQKRSSRMLNLFCLYLLQFQCCGVQGRGDWISNQIPVSCCFIDYGTISPFECNNSNAHNTGCAPLLGEWLSYNAYVIAVCAVVATCFQVSNVSTYLFNLRLFRVSVLG